MQASGSKRLGSVLTRSEGDAQRCCGPAGPQCRCLGAQQAVSPTWRMEVCDPGMQRSLRSLPLPELHAGTRSLRRRRPRRRRPPCSMLPPRWSPAALAAGQTPAPEGGNKLNNSRREDPAGLAGAACARGQTVT